MVYSRLHTKTLAFTTIQALRGQREQGYIFSFIVILTLWSCCTHLQMRSRPVPITFQSCVIPLFDTWVEHNCMMAFYKQMSCSVQCLLETKKVGEDKVVAAP